MMYDDGFKFTAKMRKQLLLVVAGAIVLFVIFKIFNTSVIDISAGSNGQATYTLLNQNSNKTTTAKTASGHIRRYVNRGNYEVRVSQLGRSYLAIVKTKSFLRKTIVSAHMMPEKARAFVGDKPGDCMELVRGVLISSACNDLYFNLNVHMPATASTPTYVQSNTNTSPYGYVHGIVHTSEGDLVLIALGDPGEGQPPYSLYRIDPTLGVSSPVRLSDLSAQNNYSIQPYRSGFIIYDSTYEQVLYYSSSTAHPEPISLATPTDSTQKATLLSVNGEGILAEYTNYTGSDQSSQGTKVTSTLSTFSNGKTNLYKLDYAPTSVGLCGTNLICAIKNTTMGVYKADAKTLNHQYDVDNVVSVISGRGGFLAITKTGLLKLDTAAATGFTDYSFGDYTFCGIQPAQSGYIVCAVNNESNRVAIFVDQTADNKGSIDQKVNTLAKMPEIDNVSTNGRYVYLTPKGPTSYNNSTHTYEPDQTVLKAVNAKIDAEIKSLGIDPAQYTIINTGA